MSEVDRWYPNAYGEMQDYPTGEYVLASDYDALRARLAEAEEALQRIVALDPEHDSDDGFNEWGEAHCFKLAQDIARAAVNGTSSSAGGDRDE